MVLRSTFILVADDNDADFDDADGNEELSPPKHRNTGGVSSMKNDGPSTLELSTVNIEQQNFPTICETYKDPITRMDVVLVMVNLPGGAQNVAMELDSEGTVVTFKYSWAKAWYNVKDLFKKFIDANETTLVHPMVLAVETAMEKCRSRIDEPPEGKMTITLPFKVQTDPFTWKKNGIVRKDGMQIVMVEFVGYVKEYHKVKINSMFVFDK